MAKRSERRWPHSSRSPFSADGAQLLAGHEPWSPDGRSLVVATWLGEEPGLFRVDLDGEPPQRLTSGRMFAPVCASDGRVACFAFEDRSGLLVLAAAAGARSALSPWESFPTGPFLPHAWSPCADWLAAGVRGGTLVLLRGDGSLWRDVGPGRRPVWSPDGASLACVVDEGEQPFIELLDVRSGTRQRLAVGDAPSFAPDGERLVIADGENVAVVGIEDGARVELARGRAPRWSPRGDRILYSRLEQDGELTTSPLLVIRPDGSDERELADDALAPRWSPDGTRISFVRGRFPESELVVLDADVGTELFVLDLLALGARRTTAP